MKTNEEIKKTLDLDTFKDEWGHSVIPRDIVDEAITTLTAKHAADIEKAVEAEKKRILDELWRLVEWHSEEKNQMFGLVSANTTINALHQARSIVRGDNYASASQTAPTKTDKQQHYEHKRH